MSNIYIQEPPTWGKVLLITSVGDIDVELWSREAPKACRNFIQLCMEGYYNCTQFHRVVKGFIVQGGDPSGDGTGGESIYGAPFKDEFHSRLRFNRRGLVAMANAGKDDNGSQFFFTMDATPELQNKHTIFGKVTGDTLFNMLKLEDALVDEDERPEYPQIVIRAEVLKNPFPDIVPRTVAKVEKEKPKKAAKKSGVKNFKLLSFGEEAEEDEVTVKAVNKKLSGKGKSSHDVLDDPKLSSEPAVEVGESSKRKPESSSDSDLSGDENVGVSESTKAPPSSETIRKKLKKNKDSSDSESSESIGYTYGQEEKLERKKKAENIRKEFQNLKKDMQNEKKSKLQNQKEETKKVEEIKEKKKVVDDYNREQEKYKSAGKDIPKKGASREAYTLQLLAKFQKKMNTVRENCATSDNKEDAVVNNKNEDGEIASEDEDIVGDDWMSHKLQFKEKGPVLAKDASKKGDDWVDIYDPRNPINQRRREDSKKILKSRRQ